MGVREGDILLCHSALRPLRTNQDAGYITPQNIIDTLLACVGKTGTLLMPALSYATVDERDNLFDVKRTKSCVGAISEVFRTEYPVVRSMHPTHSVCAWGAKAKELTERHFLDRTPVGENSPFRLLAEYDGKILMLGCGLQPMTFMHGVEELVVPDYLFRNEKVLYRLRDENGDERSVCYTRHDFAGYKQRYDRLMEVMEGRIACKEALGGQAYLLSSRMVKEKALQKLWKDAHYFVEPLEISGEKIQDATEEHK